jgi:hypothetical protein
MKLAGKDLYPGMDVWVFRHETYKIYKTNIMSINGSGEFRKRAKKYMSLTLEFFIDGVGLKTANMDYDTSFNERGLNYTAFIYEKDATIFRDKIIDQKIKNLELKIDALNNSKVNK